MECTICSDRAEKALACCCAVCSKCLAETLLNGKCFFCKTESSIIGVLKEKEECEEENENCEDSSSPFEEPEPAPKAYSDPNIDAVIKLYAEQVEQNRKNIEDYEL